MSKFTSGSQLGNDNDINAEPPFCHINANSVDIINSNIYCSEIKMHASSHVSINSSKFSGLLSPSGHVSRIDIVDTIVRSGGIFVADSSGDIMLKNVVFSDNFPDSGDVGTSLGLVDVIPVFFNSPNSVYVDGIKVLSLSEFSGYVVNVNHRMLCIVLITLMPQRAITSR